MAEDLEPGPRIVEAAYLPRREFQGSISGNHDSPPHVRLTETLIIQAPNHLEKSVGGPYRIPRDRGRRNMDALRRVSTQQIALQLEKGIEQERIKHEDYLMEEHRRFSSARREELNLELEKLEARRRREAEQESAALRSKKRQQDEQRRTQDMQRRKEDLITTQEDREWNKYVLMNGFPTAERHARVDVHTSEAGEQQKVNIRVTEEKGVGLTPLTPQRGDDKDGEATRGKYSQVDPAMAWAMRLADLERRTEETRRRTIEDAERLRHDFERDKATQRIHSINNKVDDYKAIARYLGKYHIAQQQKWIETQIWQNSMTWKLQGIIQLQAQNNLLVIQVNNQLRTRPYPTRISEMWHHRDYHNDGANIEVHSVRVDKIGFAYQRGTLVYPLKGLHQHVAEIGTPRHHDHFIAKYLRLAYHACNTRAVMPWMTPRQLGAAKLVRIEGIDPEVYCRENSSRSRENSSEQDPTIKSNEADNSKQISNTGKFGVLDPRDWDDVQEWEKDPKAKKGLIWKRTAEQWLADIKDGSSYAQFRAHLKDPHRSTEWMLKIEDLMKQVPRENKCVIWIYACDVPNYSFLKFLLLLVIFLCIIAGTVYGVLEGDLEKGKTFATTLAILAGSLVAVVASGQYMGNERPETFSYAFDSVVKCFVEETGGANNG
ncbi:hypothetical protein GQ53DRAFT_121680 [Thozetella sp. PMI_491]|nr:hypothetical protein GQ53DRAFT_121680 [Thozetella sp. PMI_491]